MASLISYFNEKRRRIHLKLWWLASAQWWGCSFPDQRVMKLTEMGQKQTSDTWIFKQTTCKENVSALLQLRGIKVLLFSILRKMPSVQMGRITPTVAIKYVLTVLSRLIRRNSNIQTNPTGATNTEMKKMWQSQKHVADVSSACQQQGKRNAKKIRQLPTVGRFLIQETGIYHWQYLVVTGGAKTGLEPRCPTPRWPLCSRQ